MAEQVYACPQCGSPSVEFSALVGGAASCNVCEWSGNKESMFNAEVREGSLGGEQTFLALYNDFRRIFREVAGPLTQFLAKWGFVQAERRGMKVVLVNPEHTVLYINAIFQGALKAVLHTREELEKGKGKNG